MRLLVLLICILSAPALWSPAFAARHALVIGNNDYQHLPKLQKAVNDARAVGAALEKIGFSVILSENLTQSEMQDRLFDLTEKLSPGDTVVLFYAGHGVALGGGNYLLPVDAPVPEGSRAENRVKLAGLAEAEVIAQVKEAGAQLAIMVLDACRDNPFARAGTRAIGATRGLSRPPEERGVFGIYSAGFGQTALDRLGDDDPNPNSVFTRVLAPALAEPGLSLVDIAYRVNEEVEKLAKSVGHEQSPAHYDQARGLNVYLALAGGQKLQTDAAPAPAPQTGVPAPSACAEAKAHYDEAKVISTREMLETHLRFYGDCAYAPAAKSLLAKLDAPAPAPSTSQATPQPTAPEEQQATPSSEIDVAAVDPQPPEASPEPASEVASITPVGTLLRTIQGSGDDVYSVAFSPDGKQLAGAMYDNAVRLWDSANGRKVRSLRGHADSPRALAFSPNGRVLASGSEDYTIKLWSMVSGNLLNTINGHDREVTTVAFSPDGQLLASGSTDQTIKLWLTGRGDLIRTLTGHTNSVRSIAFSSDGRLLASGSEDNAIKLWDTQSGKLIHTLKGHRSMVFSVSFSSDGRRLASGSNDNTIKVWDSGSGELIRTLKGHEAAVYAVAFSPPGRVLASGSADSTIKLWDVETGNLIRILEGDAPSFAGQQNSILSIAFSPDGRVLASGSEDDTIKLWSMGELGTIATK